MKEAYRMKVRIAGQPLPLIRLKCEKEGKEIWKVRYFLKLRIWLKRHRKTIKPGQCFMCQKYKHSQRNCFADDRYVKYGGNHRSDGCQIENRTPPTCANCGGSHVVSHAGCVKSST